MMNFILTIIFTLSAFTALSIDFEYQFINYGVNEGLPSAQVYEIVQDQKGYIWFGTDRGLVRFNGYDFEIFTVKDGLSTNVIFKLDIDALGRICCYGKDRKIHILNGQHFVEFKYNSRFKELHSAWSNLIAFDFTKNGFLFSLSDNAMGNAVLGSLNNEGKIILEQNSGIHLDSSGGGRIGILKTEPNVSLFFNEKNLNTDILLLKTDSPYADAAKFNNKFYFSINKTLYLFELSKNRSVKKIHEFSDDILDLKLDSSGKLYIGTRLSGLWIMDTNNLATMSCVLPDVSVSNVLIDSQNGIWVATLFKGLYYCGHQGGKKLVTKSAITLMMNYGEDIYACTEDEFLYHIVFSDSGLIIEENTAIMNSEEVSKSFARKASFGSELLSIGILYDLKTNKYISNQFSARDFFSYNDNFYVLSRAKITVYNSPMIQGISGHYMYQTMLSSGMVKNRNLLIVSTEEGVKFHLLNRDSINLSSQTKDFYYIKDLKDYRRDVSFFRTNLRTMLNVNDSILIFGSSEMGVFIERTNKPDIWLQKKDGIVSDAIDRIYVKDQYMVLITKSGASLITHNGKIKNYTVKNGLLSNNAIDALIRGNQLWISTDKGTSVFDLNENASLDLPIYLSEFRINGNAEELQHNYVIDYTKSYVDISFEGLSYPQQGEINYRYQLTGVDRNWVSTTSRNVRYVNLPYGQFEFLIAAQKGDQTWSDPIVLFKINKIKPFWEMTWFYILCIMIVLGFIWLGFNVRLQKLKRKQEDKFIMLNMERKTLQAQMHPHFVFNSLTSLQSLIVDDKKIESQEFLAKFAKLMRLALNHSTKNYILLDEEIEILTQYMDLEKVRYSDKFNYQIINELVDLDVEIPPMLIQPFVENSIKHGLANKEKEGRLLITFTKKDQFSFLCFVEDNGTGRSAKENSVNQKSLGIKLVKERLKIILSDLNVKESAVQIEDLFDGDLPSGTRVKIILPLKIREV